MVILIVDDDPYDAGTLADNIQACRPDIQVRTVYDGADALHYLRGEAEFADRDAFPLPDAIFVDLNMPVVNGHELLSELNENPEWSKIPRVVLSGMLAPETALQLGAKMCLLKPINRCELRPIVDLLCHWAASPQTKQP